MFEEDFSFFQRWDMSVPWRVILFYNNARVMVGTHVACKYAGCWKGQEGAWEGSL